MQQDRYTTSMGDRIAVKFVRRRTLAVGPIEKAYEPGDVLMLPNALAYELVDAGDAVLDRSRREMVQKDAPSHRTVEMAVEFLVEKRAGAARQVRAICSTATPDRHGDVIDQAGWDLASFRRNPVILFMHDHADPVARAVSIAVEGGKLVADIAFPDEGTVRRSDYVWGLIASGVVRAVSVGFWPLAWTPLADGSGMRLSKMDLLEVSIVSVPANPDALIEQPILSGARGVLLSAAGTGGDPLAARQPIVAATRAGTHKPPAPPTVDRAGQLDRIAALAAAAGSDRPRLAARAADLARLAKAGMVRKVIGRGSIA